jgi:hypothetical protein
MSEDIEETDRSLGDYDAHVSREKTAYLLAYEEFEKELSPDARAALGKSAAPHLEDTQTVSTRRMVFGIDRDVADSAAASYTEDMAQAIDTVADELRDRWGFSPLVAQEVSAWVESRVAAEATTRQAAVLVKICNIFLTCANARLTAAGLAYAADLSMAYAMGSMEEWASKHGLSRAAVSKSARFWKKKLCLPGGGYMRNEESCSSYSEAAKTKHWRNKKYGN